jgi:ABC-type glutathione transport system ATPase component
MLKVHPEADQVGREPQEERKEDNNASGRCIKLSMLPPRQTAGAELVSMPGNSGEVKVAQAGTYASTGEKRIRVQLTWENITVKPKARTSDKEKLILDRVSGTVRPEQFLAIIGASGTIQHPSLSLGAGKTTLLNYLSGKMFPQDLTAKGDTWVNDMKRDDIEFSRFTAFVQQDDILLDTMSVQGKKGRAKPGRVFGVRGGAQVLRRPCSMSTEGPRYPR